MKLHATTQKTGAGIFAALLLSCLPQCAMAQGNLVVNGGFDTDASGWTLTNGAFYYSHGSHGNPAGSVALINSLSTVSQEVNGLISGQYYVISGDYEGGGGEKNTITNGFGVALDGVYLFETNAPTLSSWYNFSFDYTASSASVLLSLSAPINGTGYGYYIDNISIQAVPEPSIVALTAVGGASLLYFRRRTLTGVNLI